MCKGSIKIEKKYIILMNFDYSNIFRDNEYHSLENIFVVVPKEGSFIPEKTIKYLERVLGSNLRFVDKGEQSMIDIIKEISPDVLITMGWRKIISDNVFERVNLSINIHPALLPEYKGYHPLPYLLKNNETEHGLTAHLISEEVDAGDIVAQCRFRINKFSTINSLIDVSRKEMPNFFIKILHAIEKDELVFTKQDNSKTKIIAKRRTPLDSELDVNKPLIQLFDDIRACDQERFPPFFFVDGERVFVKLWRESDDKENQYDI